MSTQTEHTAGILLDVADLRRRAQEDFAATGESPEIVSQIEFGLRPDRRSLVYEAIAVTLLSPTWSNVLSSTLLIATTAPDDDELRRSLLQVAATAVAWIEVIDEKAKNG